MTNLYAYIDETGDLGANYHKPGTSRYFGMACLLMTDAGEAAVRQLAMSLKSQFKIPNNINLSWKKHARSHERRKYISQRLATLEGVQVIYVFTDKKAVAESYVNDRGHLYNYVADKMFKNILDAAEHWDQTQKDLKVRFSHVKGLDHQATTEPYLLKGMQDLSSFNGLSELKWVDARSYKESDIADLFAGCLHAALKRDEYGNTEGSYLQNIWHLVRNTNLCGTESKHCAIPLGFMPMPTYQTIADLDSFPCEDCPQVKK